MVQFETCRLCYSFRQINRVNIQGCGGTDNDFIYFNLTIFVSIYFLKLPYLAPNVFGFEAQYGRILCEFEIVQYQKF